MVDVSYRNVFVMIVFIALFIDTCGFIALLGYFDPFGFASTRLRQFSYLKEVADTVKAYVILIMMLSF